MMKLYDVLLKAMAKKITWWEAAEIIGVTDQTMRRWRERLEADGYSGSVDRRRAKPSDERVPLAQVEQVLRLYREEYFDLNIRHFHEKLKENHDIHLSYTFVQKALQGAGLVPRGRKQREHRRHRERRPLPGMPLHVEGSKHRWFGDERWRDLIVILDDASSEIYHAQLVEEESTRTVMAGLREVIEAKGMFCALYSDRGSHFFVTVKAGEKVRQVIGKRQIRSIALPPLGCGNGGLDWATVRPEIENALGTLPQVDVWIYEPTEKYQNVTKRSGVLKLTPARVLVAEMVRRYSVFGIECTYLEVQKVGWFLERSIQSLKVADPLNLRFAADKYGPYSDRLRHLLNDLDGSYLHCNKRLSDAGPSDTIWFDEERRPYIDLYLKQESALPLRRVLDRAEEITEGFQSPLGLELLATLDRLIVREKCPPSREGLRAGLARWPAGPAAAQRKQKLFTDRLLDLGLSQLTKVPDTANSPMPMS
jgi:transposase